MLYFRQVLTAVAALLVASTIAWADTYTLRPLVVQSTEAAQTSSRPSVGMVSLRGTLFQEVSFSTTN